MFVSHSQLHMRSFSNMVNLLSSSLGTVIAAIAMQSIQVQVP